jgi:hypothetical protein
LPITLENNEEVLLGLSGTLNPQGRVESISCIVTAKAFEMDRAPLFTISEAALTWWDKRAVTESDLPFMGAIVGAVYNNVFVSAGE